MFAKINGRSRYAEAGLKVLGGTRWTKISEILPDFFAVCEALLGSLSRYATGEAVEQVDYFIKISCRRLLSSSSRTYSLQRTTRRDFQHPTFIFKPANREDHPRDHICKSRSLFYDNEALRYVPTGSIFIEEEQNSPKGTRYGSHGYLELIILRTCITYHIVEHDMYELTSFVLTFSNQTFLQVDGESDQVSHPSSLRHHHYASATISVTSSSGDQRNFVYTAMANQGERYIYQRFPYVVLNDTPSSSSGSDSDPVEASSVASQASPTVPHTPSAPRPVTPPPPPTQSASHGHSQPHAEDIASEGRHSPSPQGVPKWDGLRRMRGQARTTGLPPRHPLAPRDEP
ncbi:hypothetical protein E3N88_17893 [Mikania micrantha]|uniref:Uncharacterized protein n=1 Tax=Mikania micrantha TaxID=192012 RepID=A0A5N6NW70_9ASTR|nr:hypothetical protein E3N88_17893 [Mikania micrantha]